METRHSENVLTETVLDKLTGFVREIFGFPQIDPPSDEATDVTDVWSDPLEFATRDGAPLDPEAVQLIRHVERH